MGVRAREYIERRLTVELSGAHAAAWAWHLMVDAFARTRC
jgi:hypothetical protein